MIGRINRGYDSGGVAPFPEICTIIQYDTLASDSQASLGSTEASEVTAG